MRQHAFFAVLAATVLTSTARAGAPAYVTRWCGWEFHAGSLLCPKGVALLPSGDVLVVDNCLHRVQKLSPQGTLVGGWGGWGSAPGELDEPEQVAVGPEGWVYVTDSGNHRVQVFDPDGGFLGTWGDLGTAPGEFIAPWGIAVSEERVFVADSGNERIQAFSRVGEFLTAWDTDGAVYGLAMGPGNVLCAAGVDASRIFRFTEKGALVDAWSVPGGISDSTSVGEPTGIAILEDGRLFVGERGDNPRVVEFAPDGTFRSSWGGIGTDAGEFGSVFGLAASEAGTIYVADQNGCVHVFSSTPTPVRLMSWGLLKAIAR